MIIKDISIKNFRNYKDLNLDFSPKINIIIGDNAQGKTNLLESIYVLGITKSHRSFIDNYLIKENEKIAKITGTIKKDILDTKLEITLEKNKKTLKVDGDKIKSVGEYIQHMNLILFSPDDLELIKGSPSIRRKFLNLEASQLFKDYLIELNNYNKLLKIRNELLKKTKKNIPIDIDYFKVITNYFIQKAIVIIQYRNNLINNLNNYIEQIYYNLLGINGFNLKYSPTISFKNYDTDYLKKSLEEESVKLYQSEVRYGSSLFGPHRDDFDFYINDLLLKSYGSQGQQRLAVIAIKLAEIEVFKEQNLKPILLLDDVFSELDDTKKNNLLDYITDNIQTIITTTDIQSISPKILDNSKIIKISNAQIQK